MSDPAPAYRIFETYGGVGSSPARTLSDRTSWVTGQVPGVERRARSSPVREVSCVRFVRDRYWPSSGRPAELHAIIPPSRL